jgi:pSer/pThr/pTyr-binding forkhead associated (FHA) protein
MKLIIEDDEGRKTVVPLVREEVEITIGRQEGNTIRLTERNVSRRHAKLARRNGSVVIEDIGSYNGVKVNGDKIDGAYEIKEGDLVQIGDYDLAVQYEDAARPAASAASADRTQEHSVPATADEDAPAPGDDSDPTPRAKKGESTSIINSSQVKAAGRTRKVVDVAIEEAPRVVVVSAEFEGREFACIRSEIKIGRTDDNDVALDHRSLSRNHCKVVREDDGEWKIIDLQSSNGIQVNGDQYAQCVLHSGDTIELGHLKMRFLAPGDEASDFVEKSGKPKRKANKTVPLAIGGVVLVAALGAGGYFLTKGKPAGKTDEKPAVTGTQGTPSTPTKVTDPEPGKQPGAVAANQAQPGEQPKAVEQPATPTPPAAPDPAALKAFEAGKASLAAGRFADAEKKLSSAVAGSVEGAAELLARTRAEIESAQHLDAANKAFLAKDLETAKAELDAITEASAAATKAGTLRQKIAAAEEKLQRQQEQEEARRLAEEERRRKLEEQRQLQQQQQQVAVKPPPQPQPQPKPVVQEPPAAQNQALSDLNEGKRLASNSLKRYKEAIPFLERALAADPSLAEAHLYLGTCYARIENIKRGAFHYEEFVHARPKDPNAAAVRGILRDYFAQSGERPRWPLDP